MTDLPANETILWALIMIPVIIAAVWVFGEKKNKENEMTETYESKIHEAGEDASQYFDCEGDGGKVTFLRRTCVTLSERYIFFAPTIVDGEMGALVSFTAAVRTVRLVAARPYLWVSASITRTLRKRWPQHDPPPFLPHRRCCADGFKAESAGATRCGPV